MRNLYSGYIQEHSGCVTSLCNFNHYWQLHRESLFITTHVFGKKKKKSNLPNLTVNVCPRRTIQANMGISHCEYVMELKFVQFLFTADDQTMCILITSELTKLASVMLFIRGICMICINISPLPLLILSISLSFLWLIQVSSSSYGLWCLWERLEAQLLKQPVKHIACNS